MSIRRNVAVGSKEMLDPTHFHYDRKLRCYHKSSVALRAFLCTFSVFSGDRDQRRDDSLALASCSFCILKGRGTAHPRDGELWFWSNVSNVRPSSVRFEVERVERGIFELQQRKVARTRSFGKVLSHNQCECEQPPPSLCYLAACFPQRLLLPDKDPLSRQSFKESR